MSTFLDDLYRFGGASEIAMGDSSAPTILSDSDKHAQVLRLTGTLTAARRLVVPIVRGDYIVLNDTTQAVTVGAQTGTTVSLASGTRALICCDGENYYVVSAGTTGGGGGGATTLAGDASGPSTATVVTHVTGASNTKINSTTDVALQVNGTDVAKVDAAGMTLGSPDLHYLNGFGAPTVSAPNGSQYLRRDASAVATSVYYRVNGAWVVK